MSEINLGNGYKTLIDEEDLNLTIGYLWRRRCNGYVGAYKRGRTRLTAKNIALHRLIMGVIDNPVHIDHINGNKLDNRKSNLRLATMSQNLGNQRKQNRKTSSRFKGVSFNTEKMKWAAYINCHGKRYRLGYYISEIMAALSYDKMANILFGEYAKPNFKYWPFGFMDGI